MSVIPISTDLAKHFQSVFFGLYLLLKRTSCGESAAVILIAIGSVCVVFYGSLPILVSHNDRQY